MQNWQSLTNIPPQDAAFEMAEDTAIPDQKTLMLVSWLTESATKQSVTRNILDRNIFYRGVHKHLLFNGGMYIQILLHMGIQLDRNGGIHCYGGF